MNNLSNHTTSPRQRMINLMYLVFIALLALNVSSDTFDAFDLLDMKLNHLLYEIENKNKQMYQLFLEKNEKPLILDSMQQRVDFICNYIFSLKKEMIKAAEGKNAGTVSSRHKENTEAVARVMLSPVKGEAKRLYSSLKEFQQFCETLFPEEETDSFSFLTFIPSRKGLTVQTWETTLFENRTVGEVLPVMTELELNIRWAESILLKRWGTKEKEDWYRPFNVSVLAESPLVLYGDKWKGRIVLDLDHLHGIKKLNVNNEIIPMKEDGSFELETSSPGSYTLAGKIEFQDGINSSLPFEINYCVTDPFVTISPVKLNVLYAGYENELRIAVPGIPTEQLKAEIDQGRIFHKQNNSWIAIPDKPGEEVTITIHYKQHTKQYKQPVSFRVLKLPDPNPFIVWKDEHGYHQARAGTITKDRLLKGQYLEVGYEDNWLDASFDIVSFEFSWFDSFGNRLNEKTSGKYITERQRDIIRNFPSGKTGWFSGIKVIGEDRIERMLPAMELVIN